MTEPHFTARELADMALPNFPATKMGIIKKASAESWPSVERQGRGGGRMYPISAIKDPAIRLAILSNHTGSATPTGMCVPHLDAKDAALRSKQLRGDAILFIVRRFDAFRDHHGLKMKQAESLFIDQFGVEKESREFQWFADWVMAVVPTFSIQSLRRWRSGVEQDPKTVYAQYNNRKGKSILAMAEGGAVQNRIVGLLHHKPHIKAGHVRDYIRAQFGDMLKITDENGVERSVELPQIRAFERFLIQWKVENASTYLKIADPDGWKNRHMVAFGSASGDVHRLNQRWEIDASPADVLLADGRYSIYAIIDVWSRRVLFSVSKTACTDASLMLVRRAIMEWGVPETLKTDNGADFTSHRFVSAIQALNIRLQTCMPFTPEGKPHVERVIKTMQHDLMEMLPGYVGHSVADRKKIEAQKAFAHRLGESDKEAFAIKMDHVELQDYMDRWVKDRYSHKKHSSLGVSPFAKAATWDMPIMRIDNIRALDLLLAPLAGTDGFRVITKKGLRIDNGIFYGPNLELYVGHRVFVRHDPEDMGRVYVFTPDQEFICEALNQERLGADPAQAASEAKARQKQYIAEETKEVRRLARKITPEKIAEDVLSKAARDNSKLAQFPQRSEIYASASLDEAARVFDRTTSDMTQEQQTAHEVFVANFNAAPEREEKAEERWERRLLNIESQLEMGIQLDPEEVEWFEYVQDTSWYRAREIMKEMKNEAGE